MVMSCLAAVGFVAARRLFQPNEGEVETASEVLVFFKTTAARFAALQEKLKSLHPYDTPEIISFRIDEGSPDYLRWVTEN